MFKKAFKSSFIASALLLLTTSQTFAVGIELNDWGDCIERSSKIPTIGCVPVVLQNLINFLLMFAGIVAIFLIIYAGVKFVTSQGDPQKVEAARKTFFYAVIGFAFILFSFVVVNFIAQFTGVKDFIKR